MRTSIVFYNVQCNRWWNVMSFQRECFSWFVRSELPGRRCGIYSVLLTACGLNICLKEKKTPHVKLVGMMTQKTEQSVTAVNSRGDPESHDWPNSKHCMASFFTSVLCSSKKRKRDENRLRQATHGWPHLAHMQAKMKWFIISIAR